MTSDIFYDQDITPPGGYTPNRRVKTPTAPAHRRQKQKTRGIGQVSPRGRRPARSAKPHAELPTAYAVIPKARLIRRIGPRSLIGVLTTLAALAIGMGISGGVFYAYYSNRLDQFERHLDAPLQTANNQLVGRTRQVDNRAQDVISQIKQITGPLQSIADDPKAIVQIPSILATKMWQVHTSDPNGAPTVGSAFAIATDATNTYLLTNLQLVVAAATTPGPALTVTNGSQNIPAKVYSTDQQHGVALLQIAIPKQPVIQWATPTQIDHATGARVYSVSAWGSTGAVTDPGYILDTNTNGYIDTLPADVDIQGGPIVLSSGAAIGVSTTGYYPQGYKDTAVPFAPSMTQICQTILNCTTPTPTPTPTSH